MTYLRFCYLAGILLVLSQLSLCQKNSTRGSRGCHGRRCHRHDHGNVTTEYYAWSRSLENNVNIDESAAVIPEKKIVLLYSNDTELLNLNITKATTLYSFFNDSKFGVIKPRLRRFPCIQLESVVETYEGVSSELKKRNGTTVTATSKRSLVALDAPLTQEEREKLFNQSTAVSIHCKRRDVVKAKPGSGTGTLKTEDIKNLQFLELNGLLTVTVPAKLRNSISRRRFGNETPANKTKSP
ncbi:hypothetical protein BgiMline_027406 [Biomphalaria glabrata]|nr:hypothetical protein BgiMline_025201 [Biomphalaria glabrata]